MAENFTIRISDHLMERIDAYAKSKEIKRSDGIRSLIELGLKINDIKEDEIPDIEDEFKKILIELCIRQNQQYLFAVRGISKEEVQVSADQVKSKMKERYPLISSKYNEFLYPKK